MRLVVVVAAGVGVLALASAAGPAGAADPVEADFRRACLEGEPEALKRSDTWAWIEDLCGRAAAERAAAFRAAGRDGRLALLAEDCVDWYANNRWRLPERLAHDARPPGPRRGRLPGRGGGAARQLGF